jgi:hypothetical protein
MKSITRIAHVLVVLALLIVPSLVAAQTQIYTGQDGFSFSRPGFSISWGTGAGGYVGSGPIGSVGANIINIINNVLVPVIFALAFIVFLYGVFLKYIFSHGDATKVSEGHKLILWGLIGFVVMISLWGLVNVIAITFGLGGFGAPGSAGSPIPIPRSY